MDITFANKEYLLGLLIIIPLIAWYILRHKKQHAHIEIASTIPFGRFLKTNNIGQHLLFGLLCATLSMLIIALARPQSSMNLETKKTKGIDIVISLDISLSMLAKDFSPNRLTTAKKVGMEFVSHRPNDRIGLVVFSGESYTQCPLTTDQRILMNLFSKIQTNYAIEGGTAIGSGLATAINRLRDSDAKSKVIILLTDGENNGGTIDPETAAELAEKFGIKVYTIGMGSNGSARTPVSINNSGQIIFRNMPVKLDEKLLQKIANITHGKYFRATNTTKLKEIYQEIDKLEKTEIEKNYQTNRNELFQIFAGIGFLLLALYLFFKFLIFKTTP